MKLSWGCVALCLLFACGIGAGAQISSSIVVFDEPDFPTVDTATFPSTVLRQAIPSAVFATSAELSRRLSDKSASLLILPHGSAFPVDQWRCIKEFLVRGGNLLTLGGRPFTRPARFVNGAWQVLPETYAFARQLLISDYQETPGSASLKQVLNQDEAMGTFTELRWQRAYSMVIRLSQEEAATRVGASGTFDSQIRTLLWGVSGARRVSAPIVEVDHFQNDFASGRWVMVNCYLERRFLEGPHAAAFLAALVRQSAVGAELLRVTPTYPLYRAEETWQLQLQWNRFQQPAVQSKVFITINYEGHQEAAQTFDLETAAYPVLETFVLATTGRPGFHSVEVRMRCGAVDCGIYHTAFWVEDKAYLNSGPKVTVDHDFFRVDGQPIEVVGTTYMASDAQRLYFRYPNPFVWDQDFKQISGYGLNMLRTGLWTDWEEVTGNTSVATERALRTMEAFLMTARKYDLPVQFNLFAFMPEVFGGVNPYLDPEAIRRQQQFVSSIVKPFAKVPFLIWDIINEPSFDNPRRFFSTRSNRDAAETGKWNSWLLRRYGDRSAIESAWKTSYPDGPIPAPNDQDATAQSANDGGHPLAIYDFNLFAQESFAAWAEGMHTAIRNAGSQQLITVGQDEGGALTSPSPAFFYPAIDFSTMHSWWLNDDLLWDSLASRQKGMPMLVQETGVMTEVDPDGRPRRSLQADAALLEKKLGIAIATGAGAIEWLWNINAVMRSQQEITIGAVRPDGTEKPEAQVLQAYANFARQIRSHLIEPRTEEVSILTSQTSQYFVNGTLAIDAQHRAVRVMNYQCHIPAKVVTENHVVEIRGSRLTVLPSGQALRDSTWQALMAYVEEGGNLLLTGPVERDEHWVVKNRLRQLGIDATSTALNYRGTTIQLGTESTEASFSLAAQKILETLQIAEERSFLEVKKGKGRIFIVASPVELAESPDATTMVYQYVLAQLTITPQFDGKRLPSAVLVRPQVFKDSVLYLLISESSINHDIDIRDKVSGGTLKFNLAAMRTKLVVLDRATGTVIATYNGPQWATEQDGSLQSH